MDEAGGHGVFVQPRLVKVSLSGTAPASGLTRGSGVKLSMVCGIRNFGKIGEVSKFMPLSRPSNLALGAKVRYQNIIKMKETTQSSVKTRSRPLHLIKPFVPQNPTPPAYAY